MNYRAVILLVLVVASTLWVGFGFRKSQIDEALYPSPALTKTFKLSDYFGSLKGTRGDTDVYEFQSGQDGGTVLVLGGTHCDEPASYLAAYMLIERLQVNRGRVLVIPRANRSALSHTMPGEAHPQHFDIQTETGSRQFRMGCRYTNPLDQWPDPEVYLHYPSNQELSGADSRNLNRCYPGRADGRFTERIAYAITTLVDQEKVDLVIDLHEASLEYPVINAIVAHDRAMDCAAMAVLELQIEGLEFALEPSPPNFHGLSHRELGDHTPTDATLMESANVIQGRLRGKTDANVILTGKDPMYVRAAQIDLTRVPYDEAGIPIEVRVGRHIEGAKKLISSFSVLYEDRAVEIDGLPTYDELQTEGVGAFLSTPTASSQ
ncbi:MAG: succinylglutamate desuccinylase/aspartoacylase family protein [Calditrichaeota bacterium]|nr:succinylglutamate desuccinylase/aspartoacylase family protein [Calditrichota bacterium]MCB9367841.1 succinylglutamate desuccinylase/aspartoacylase family protein [Calditrichota bacterium]